MSLLLIKAAPTLLGFFFGVAFVSMPMAGHPGMHGHGAEAGAGFVVPIEEAPVPVPAEAIAPAKEAAPAEPAREQE